jgi:phage/plasmid-like protein (TIGR03299 family)
MAHQVQRKEDMFASIKQTWHKVNLWSDVRLTPQQAGDLVLSWPAIERLLGCAGVNMEAFEIPDKKAVFHGETGQYIATVGKDAWVTQPSELVAICEEIIGDKALVESGGCLYGGNKLWMLVKLGEDFRVGNDSSAIKSYGLLSTTLDGTGKTTFRFTNVRVECDNTLQWALKDSKAEFSVRHTKNGKEIAMQKATIMRGALEYGENFKALANILADRRFSQPQMVDVAKKLYPATRGEKSVPTVTKNNRTKIVDLFTGGKGHDSIRNTAWAAVNAVAEYTDHHMSIRAGSKSPESSRQDSVWFGSGAKLKQRALGLVIAETGILDAVSEETKKRQENLADLGSIAAIS